MVMHPRIETLKEFYRKNEKLILLTTAFVCIFVLGFLAGRTGTLNSQAPVISIEKSSINSSILKDNIQSQSVLGENQSADSNCAGKIKGNISSSGKIYHVPGGSFYNRTQPEMCFNTEAEAQAAGFKRSQR